MDKRKITKQILSELNPDLSLEKALYHYWWVSSNDSNLRLTIWGMRALSKLMDPHEFEYRLRVTGNNLRLLLNIQSPFYIDFEGTVTVFGEQLVSLIVLYGSFEKYMESLTDDRWD